MSMRVHGSIGLWLALPLFAFSQQSKDFDPRAALIAAQANFDAFESFDCRFTITRGLCKNEEQVLSGTIQDAKQCEYLLIKKGDKYRLQGIDDREFPANRKNKPGGIVPVEVPCIPFAKCSNTDLTLRFDRFLSMATLSTPDGTQEDAIPTPINLNGTLSPERRQGLKSLMASVQKGNTSIRRVKQRNLDGLSTLSAYFEGDDTGIEIVFDLNKSFLPISATTWLRNGILGGRGRVTKADDPVRTSVCAVLETKECGDGKWFPIRIRTAMVGAPRKGGMLVSELHVSSFDHRRKIEEEELQIKLPAGTVIQWREHRAKQSFRLKQNESIGPNDLSRIKEMLEMAAREVPMDTAVQRRTRSRIWVWVVGGFGVALSLILCLRALRRFDRR